MDDIFVPALGHAMEECVLVDWLVPPGTAVAEGQEVATIETDKSTMELTAPSAGRLGRHRYGAGAHVPVGEVIAYVLLEGEHEPDGAGASGAGASGAGASGVAAESGNLPDGPGPEPHEIPDAPAPGPHETPGAAGPATTSGVPTAERRSSPLARRRMASPRARRLQQEAEAAAMADGPATRPATRPGVGTNGSAPAARQRAAVAESVLRSWTTIPHFTVSRDIPADGLLRLQADQRAAGVPVTFTDLLLKVFALALAQALDLDAPPLGLAVATGGGVVISVLPDPGGRGLADLAGARASAAERARTGRAGPDDALSPVATLSNLGSMGVRAFTGIIPIGQRILLTTGMVDDRAVFDDHGISRRRVFDATLNLDHRYYDGAHGAGVLARMAELAADPAVLAGSSARPTH